MKFFLNAKDSRRICFKLRGLHKWHIIYRIRGGASRLGVSCQGLPSRLGTLVVRFYLFASIYATVSLCGSVVRCWKLCPWVLTQNSNANFKQRSYIIQLFWWPICHAGRAYCIGNLSSDSLHKSNFRPLGGGWFSVVLLYIKLFNPLPRL